jgi:hypothetical protein
MSFQEGSAGTFPRRTAGEALRVLFCLGVTPAWYEATRDERDAVLAASDVAFGDLRGRFGLEVLGTFDDDELMVGASVGWPWIGYILAEAPDFESVVAACNVVRDTKVGDYQLWKYYRIEARIGSAMYFGNA